MKEALTNDPVSRPYKVVTEVEQHACPSCHQDAEGHIVVGADGIGFGTTYFGDDGKEEAEELADMLNDAYEAGRESIVQNEALAKHRKWLADRVEWLKYEMDRGGDWKYLSLKREETAYCLEKLDAHIPALEKVDGRT